ncbi:elongation factor G [Caldicellulosiruptor naganoensis]|uniref:Elongation factor G n=1 Tax=Caldicellulosiruptor naganoensis TaxID=29324 RepID=A0ABY7BIM3_9FIRM|nr:elongation factor G [Caldicellulosiruptor naganoensis]WAM32345.1 elongation factor G [Caldicellulosiruptor naganoensis]
MKEYAPQYIKNVVLLGHGGDGKTILTDSMLFNAKCIDRIGKIEEGTTTSDFDPEEIKRRISISMTVEPLEWGDYKINILDTPGYFDFVGEVCEAVHVADAAILVVGAKTGVQVGTEKGWELAETKKLPVLIFVNKMDEENADFDKVLRKINDVLTSKAIPIQYPIVENGKFAGFVDIISKKAYVYENNSTKEVPIPSGLSDKVEEIRNSLIEAAVENDEELMEKYFTGEEISIDEIYRGLKLGVSSRSVFPVMCGAASKNLGVKELLDAIIKILPSSQEKHYKVKDTKNSSETLLKPDVNFPVCAFVFKTVADPFVGRITFLKVISGTLRPDMTLYNTTSERQEKVSQLFIIRGKKQIPVPELKAGDIGVVTKLQSTLTNNTLCDPSRPLQVETIEFPRPWLMLAIEPKAKGDEEKISNGLHRLMEEDLTFKIEKNNETGQNIIYGIGELHIDVIVNKLKNKFGVSVVLSDPKVPYRETIKKKVKSEGKYKKQTGGHGQYGHVFIEFEPSDSEDLVFEEKIFGGAVPKQYIPAVEKGLRECIKKGVLAGYPVMNLKATLVDGSYHPVDSSELAFKVATSLAYKKGLAQANPVLLEPIMNVKVIVPESYTGDIMGDLNRRRGRVLGMEPVDKNMEMIEAEVPLAEMFKYATDLRSMTQGRGSFTMEFVRYEEVPSHIAQKVIEAAKAQMTEEEK